MSDEEKLVSHYRLKTLLRRDGFGSVYFAEDTRDQKTCILRIIQLDQQTLTRITGRVRARAQRDHPLIEQIRQRMKRISELRNPHILPVSEFGEEHSRGNNDMIFYMVSPYEKESLLSYWSEHTSDAELLSLEIIADLLLQAAEALHYVHRRGLVHQYIHLSSFMIRTSTRRRHPHLLLTDFWFADITAAILEEGQFSQGLSVYLAPEQLSGKAVAASDQYALAILAYELLMGHRLAQVDLSLGLYERFVRQHQEQANEAELEVARRLDLVLARALDQSASARFNNIEEFALTFRAVSRAEDVDLRALDEETIKLPAAPSSNGRGNAGSIVAVSALEAEEVVEELKETRFGGESEDETYPRHHPGLHKTVLTSEGMEAKEVIAAGEVVQREAASSEEQTRHSARSAAAFAAGLAAGQALQQETDIAAEKTQIRESSAAAFAAGLAAGEILTSEQKIDIVEEQTQSIPASGMLVTNAAGLVAGEILASGMEATRVAGVGAVETVEAASPLTLEANGAVTLVGAGLVTSATVPVTGAFTGETTQQAGGVIGVAGGGVIGRRPRRRRGRTLLAAITIALLLVLIGGSVVAFALNQSSAIVTLTLESHTIQNTYLITAATSTTTTGQIQATALTQTIKQSKTGQASGYYTGSHAGGFITFYNSSTGCGCPIFIPAGTAFTGASGVTVVTDTGASVASLCSVTVSAHAVSFGPGGDIPSGDIHATLSSNSHISAVNTHAFGGGLNGQSNALVQQSDVDHLASSLRTQVLQSAQTGIQARLKSTERLFAEPVCHIKTTSNHAAGDFATSVTVTVSASCTAEAYDYAAAVTIVQQQVQTEASTYFSDRFVLVGGLQTMVTNTTLVDAKTGTLLLAIKAVGKWAYKLGNNLAHSLSRVIAGKSVGDARSLLASQIGVAAVNIAVSGRDPNTLPSDDSNITIVLKS